MQHGNRGGIPGSQHPIDNSAFLPHWYDIITDHEDFKEKE